MTHFHARLYRGWFPSQTIYRIYVTDTDLLFIHLGVKTLHPEEYAQVNAASVGGLIGAVIGHCAANIARERLDRITKALEVADEEVLRKFAEEDEDSFMMAFGDVQDVRFEKKTLWSSLLCRDILAFLKCSSFDRGPMTMALIAPNEMVTALGEMQRVFGDVPCELSWRAF